MSKEKLIKAIESLKGNSKEIKEIKLLAKDIKNKISNTNQLAYIKDIGLSRLKRKLNNSKQAIKKKWNKRHDEYEKEKIKKHIKIAKESRIEIMKQIEQKSN